MIAALLLFDAGPQSALNPAANAARITAGLMREFTILLGVIFLIVIGVALVSLMRRHRGIEQEPMEVRHLPSDETEKRLGRVVGAASILTTVILLGLIVISVMAGKAISDNAIPQTRSRLRSLQINGGGMSGI